MNHSHLIKLIFLGAILISCGTHPIQQDSTSKAYYASQCVEYRAHVPICVKSKPIYNKHGVEKYRKCIEEGSVLRFFGFRFSMHSTQGADLGYSITYKTKFQCDKAAIIWVNTHNGK